MNKLISFTTGMVLFLVFLAPLILALPIEMIPAADQPGYNSNKRLSIYGERILHQKFVSTRSYLTSVATSVRNPNLKNKKGIFFKLFDDKGIELRTVVVNGQNFEDGDFVKFIFDPIGDSLNKSYTFTISSPSAGPEETIEVFLVDTSPNYIIEYDYDNNTYQGGIPLVTYHRPVHKLDIVKNIYSEVFARLFRI